MESTWYIYEIAIFYMTDPLSSSNLAVVDIIYKSQKAIQTDVIYCLVPQLH